MGWKKWSTQEIRQHVFDALEKNRNYSKEMVLGIPASYLDPKVFQRDDKILNNAPFLSTMVENPNHIGCHTLDSSESFFQGTQEIEREAIAICAEDILKCDPGSYDGYIASGGTEANIQAIWIYRNLFMQEYKAEAREIVILCSEHSHYSMDKAANLLGISIRKVTVGSDFQPDAAALGKELDQAQQDGVRYVIVVANMMTTMFGSVDDPEIYVKALNERNLHFRMHVDGAYGGFYYPFSNREFNLNFATSYISSVTLDAHKMAQAPYGTGVFIARKGLINYSQTKEASYVEGHDSTLIGSRSGANAIAVWMILATYGKYGWMEKIFILQKRTDWFCEQLTELSIQHFRNPFSNIVTMKAKALSPQIAADFGLVPDDHLAPNWYKVVIMDHVEVEKLEALIAVVKNHNNQQLK